MLNKCINCCKWITCTNASGIRNDCQDFKFKRIKIKYERKEEYEKRKRNKKSN